MQQSIFGPTTFESAGAFSGIFVGMILVSAVVGAILTVIPFWKICSKAGFPGALSLLMLVPVANVVLPFYIAFARWPALPERY